MIEAILGRGRVSLHVYHLVTYLILIWFSSCTQNEEDLIQCNNSPVADEGLYHADSDPVMINYAEIIGDCLELRFGFSGCSEDASIALVDSEVIMDSSFPAQRNIKISLEQDGICAISFNSTLRYDISTLKVTDSNQVQLNLMDWTGELIYFY